MRLLSLFFGGPNGSVPKWLMGAMYKHRKPIPNSQLRPECLALRTVRSPWQLTPQPAKRNFRVNSSAYSPSSEDGGVSIDVGQALASDGFKPRLERAVSNPVGLMGHSRSFLERMGLLPHHEPVMSNWYHGNIRDLMTLADGDRRRMQRKLADECTPAIPIDTEAAIRHWSQVRGVEPF